MILTVEKLLTLPWVSFFDEITKRKISYLENFRELTNPFSNCINIVTEVRKGKTTHNLYACSDEWGETGTMGLMTGNLSVCKKEAVRIIKEKIEAGQKFHY